MGLSNRNIVLRVHARKLERGFTLTEIAIVLGIIGLILGAIWTAASSVYANQKVGKANTEILAIAQGVRSLYATSAVTNAGADGTDITSAMCNAGVFPSDMIVSCATPTVVNPWSGNAAGTTIATTSITGTNTGDGFEVSMTAVPSAGCISLMTALGGAGRDSGLFYLGVPAYTVGTGQAAWPVTPAFASSATQCLAAATNTINIVFKLKG